ncbi:MAG: PQQ-binding-like beta-propeller repeat protein [Bacteroidota bacterium]
MRYFLVLSASILGGLLLSSMIGINSLMPVYYKLIGGKGIETNNSLFKTSDGNYVLAGRTDSYSIGDMNMNVVKVNEEGNVVWDKNFGAEESEEASSGIEASDKHLMIVGHSDSYGGGVGMKDFMVLRLDEKGLLKWQKTYGTNTSIDEASDIVETEDGNFLVVGTSLSLETAASDVMAVMIDKNGNEIWRKTYGFEKNDGAKAVIRTKNGFTIVGQTESLTYGRWEVWVISIDKEGEQVWQRSYGGPDNEMANTIVEMPDGNFVVAGFSYSFSEGSSDAWAFEITADGKKIWDKNLGGMSTDEFFDAAVAADGNVVLAGYTDVYVPNEYFENTSTLGHNIFLAKLNRKGELYWKNTLGGEQMQVAHGIVESHQKDGFVLSGYTNEDIDNKGMDMFVIKVGKNGK